MKRQVQQAGVRKYFGDDLVGLQAEPLAAIDAFFAEHGPCIIQGCEVTSNSAGGYDVAAGMVALDAEDTAEVRRVMVMPFAGAAGVSMPLYLSAQRQAISRVYGDGKSKPIAYDYKAVASAVKPAEGTAYLEITAAGGLRFVDVMQDAAHRFITDAERTKWNAAQDNAESHADNAAAEAEETAVRDAVLRTRLTGARLDKGYFKTADESLLFTGDRTMRIVFVTGDDVTTRQAVFRDGYNNQHNTVSVAENWITGRVGGTSYQTAAQANTLYEVVLVKTADGCKAVINNVVQNKDLADNAAEARFIEVGNSENMPFFGRIISARIFNFAFSDTDIASSWNDGHPELWCVPNEWRRVRSLGWPTATYKPEAETWARNTGNAIRTDNVAAANGFSGNFQRFEIPEGGTAISIYNAFQRYDGKTRRERQRVRFEYRSSGSISARTFGSFAANTGDAAVAEIIGETSDYMVIELNGQPGGYIEIRTLAIDAVGCLLDLTPAGLTPTIWYDTSGQEHNVPYFLNGNKAGEVELSYDTTGFPDTTAADRGKVLAYANRYDADREDVLVCMVDANAGQALADHAADAVKHITASERSTWNAKETPDGAQEKADAAENTAVRDAVLRGRTTGAIMGKGLFKSSAAALTTEVAGQPHTTVVVFITPATASSGNLSVYNEGTGGNIGYGCHIFHTSSNVVVSMRGLQIAAKTVPLGTLCCVAVSYDGDTRCIAAINGTATVKEAPAYVYPHEPQRFLLGGTEAAADAGTLPGVRLVAARRFNFALTAEELTAIWNGGHPELWCIPAVWRDTTLVDLVPAGLTPAVWYDASGRGNDVSYVAAGSNPAEVELSDSIDGYPDTTLGDREALLEYGARYTEVREELLLRLSADEAARRDEAVKAYADEVGNTALDASTAYTDEKLAEKQGKIANIVISDFDTFNPSNVAEIKNLADGEFACFTSYDAVGRPDTGTSTAAKICTGRITKLRSGYYRLEALVGSGSLTAPQAYTRLYISGVAQAWQAATEALSYGTDGCVTLPSGLLIQWGRYSPATGSSALPISITFPKKFKTTPLHVTLTHIDSTAAQEVWSLTVRTYTTTGITVMPNKLLSGGAVEATGCQFFWMAVGQAE